MQEEWRPIEDFPEWAVSDQGHILNEWTNRVMSTRTNQSGLVMVGLLRDRVQHMRSVALIVAKAFVENPKPDIFNSVVHLNGDRTDCRAENLMWRPRWYALKYHKMFDFDPYNVAVYVRDTDEVFEKLRDFCMKYGLIESYTYENLLNRDPVFHYGWNLERYVE